MKKVKKFKKQLDDFDDRGKFKPVRKKSKKIPLKPIEGFEKKPIKFYFEEE